MRCRRRDLEAGQFDIAMAGIYASTQRLSALSSSMSYYRSPIALLVPTARAQKFASLDEILAMRSLRLVMSVDPVLHPLWQRLFPNAEITMVSDYRTPPDFSKVDAAVWTLEQAAAFAHSHPGITAVVLAGPEEWPEPGLPDRRRSRPTPPRKRSSRS